MNKKNNISITSSVRLTFGNFIKLSSRRPDWSLNCVIRVVNSEKTLLLA